MDITYSDLICRKDVEGVEETLCIIYNTNSYFLIQIYTFLSKNMKKVWGALWANSKLGLCHTPCILTLIYIETQTQTQSFIALKDRYGEGNIGGHNVTFE